MSGQGGNTCLHIIIEKSNKSSKRGGFVKSYLSLKHQILLAFVLLMLWFLDVSLFIPIILIIAIIFLFRQQDAVSAGNGSYVAPVSGKIKSIVQKDGFADIEIIMPWWGGMGIHLPFYAELKNKKRQKGKAFFRYDFFHGRVDRRGTILVFEEIGTSKTWELVFGECTLGGGVHIIISPGDRGAKGASIGYFLLGGVVRLRFLLGNCRLSVRRGDRLVGGVSEIYQDGE